MHLLSRIEVFAHKSICTMYLPHKTFHHSPSLHHHRFSHGKAGEMFEGRDDLGVVMQPGMVFTIEPIIVQLNARKQVPRFRCLSDGWTVSSPNANIRDTRNFAF
jgi:hypothetical protein